MGSAEIKTLGAREGWGFIGISGLRKGSYVFGEQKGANVRAAMTLGYAKKVKKTVRKASKVEGGSRFEVHSAGRANGNYAKILLNGEQIPTSQDA
jgi:hypothetical protein